MEVKVRERLIGAFVLVAMVVLFVPALLKGRERAADTAEQAGHRSIEIPVRGASEPAREETLVPEPLPPAMAPANVDESSPPAAQAPVEPAPETAPAPAPEPARGDADAPSTGVAPGQPAWAVQLGAFSTREKADALVAQLRKGGYPAFVLEYRAGGKVLHRVRVGPEQDRERASAIAERLRKDGFQPVVAPHP
jgi:DedD protein